MAVKGCDVLEKRIYFHDNKIIRHLTKEASVPNGKDWQVEMRNAKNKHEKIEQSNAEYYIKATERFIAK